jgi:hypothetical protein
MIGLTPSELKKRRENISSLWPTETLGETSFLRIFEFASSIGFGEVECTGTSMQGMAGCSLSHSAGFPPFRWLRQPRLAAERPGGGTDDPAVPGPRPSLVRRVPRAMCC